MCDVYSAERGQERIKNEIVKKMRRTSMNGGDLKGGFETRRQLTKKYVYHPSCHFKYG